MNGPPAASAQPRMTKALRALARGWMKRGRARQAILTLNKLLEADPRCLEAYLDLGELLMQQHRWTDLIALCRRGLRQYVEASELHKMLITALEERDSPEDACAHYQLERIDDRCLAIAPEEILCCVVVRNEKPRLAGFFAHYRRLGVNRFLFVDNGSEDGSVEWLLSQGDVHLWRSPLPFKQANFGSSWFELLLRRHGVDHWCLTVDIDEMLVYEGYRHRPLRAFCGDLDRQGFQAASGVLLDLYGDRPIRDTRCAEGEDPLTACPYFDRAFCHTREERGGQYHNQTIFFGGVRQRVFPATHSYLLSKVPLLRYRPDVVLSGGQHLTTIPHERLARELVCLLHFKFLASFLPYARGEAVREAHAADAEQYKAYAARIGQDEALTLYDPGLSVRFEGTAHLRALGVMEPEPPPPAAGFPSIAPVGAGPGRPFWSVMITLYRRLHNLERVVGSVLRQATPDMEIEVINDGAEPEIQRELARRLQGLAGGRVRLHAVSANVGHPDVFNLCIERARGEWVHILHDDDWVKSGFYAALRDGIARAPEIGAAFCQHTIVTQGRADPTLWHSWVERETPGVIGDWLTRIAVECRVQFSAMAVRRSVYESLGGFCAEARSAFDWEMWKRIAVRHPVWYVPEILVFIGRDGSAESSRLRRSGEEIANSLSTVAISRAYLPAAAAERLSEKARERFCLDALALARQFLESGHETAALANIRAALATPPSARVSRVLVEVLTGVRDEFCP